MKSVERLQQKQMATVFWPYNILEKLPHVLNMTWTDAYRLLIYHQLGVIQSTWHLSKNYSTAYFINLFFFTVSPQREVILSHK